MENLYEAHRNARKDKSWYKEVKMVDKNPEKYLREIQEMLTNHTYSLCLEDYSISIIKDKKKERELWKLSYYPHRIIQWAILLQTEAIFMENFADFSCAAIKGRGIHCALARTIDLVNDTENCSYCLKIDIKKYYHSINQEILKKKLRKIFSDTELLALLDTIIDSRPPRGVPIGSYLSQFLANFYLTETDKIFAAKVNNRIVRYMDDIVFFSSSKEELHSIRRQLQKHLKEELDLDMKNNYAVFPVRSRGVDFVGYVVRPNSVKLRKSTKINLVRKMKKLRRAREFTYSDYCCYNSYCGWLLYLTDDSLARKYLFPLRPVVQRFYKTHLGGK